MKLLFGAVVLSLGLAGCSVKTSGQQVDKCIQDHINRLTYLTSYKIDRELYESICSECEKLYGFNK